MCALSHLVFFANFSHIYFITKHDEDEEESLRKSVKLLKYLSKEGQGVTFRRRRRRRRRDAEAKESCE